MLKDLTIVIIDSLNYDATVIALEYTKKIFPDAKVLVFSDREFCASDTFVKVDKFNGIEHSRICLQEVGKHVDTNWALFIQYDGFPSQPEYWTDDFLQYDYIGAPWFKNDQWTVGNGGFSFRSKKLLDLTPHCPQVNDGDIGMLEDQVISISSREWLESQGIKFAPVEVASQFAVTEPIKKHPSFGFHGHGMIPEYLGKEETLRWLDSIDNDFSVYNRFMYTMPYHLWVWGEHDRLRDFMLRANKVNYGWTNACWDQCCWRIPLAHPEVDLWELQKMITVYGYTGS